MTSNLPKPPPKAPPRAVPGAAEASKAMPAPMAAAKAAPAAAVAAPARPGAPAKPHQPTSAAPAKTASIANAQPAPSPSIAISGLPPALASMAVAVQLFDDVLRDENLLLRAHDTKGVAALQDRKMAATRLYQERMRALLRDEKTIVDLTDDKRRELIALTKGMEARAEENAALLKGHMEAIERLFETINAAVLQKKNPDVTYSRRGTVNGSLGTNASAIAYNTTT